MIRFLLASLIIIFLGVLLTCYSLLEQPLRERGIHATLDLKTIKNCHHKLMTTGSVKIINRPGRPSTSRTPENITVVNEMLTRSSSTSERAAARETDLTHYAVQTILIKHLSFKP